MHKYIHTDVHTYTNRERLWKFFADMHIGSTRCHFRSIMHSESDLICQTQKHHKMRVKHTSSQRKTMKKHWKRPKRQNRLENGLWQHLTMELWCFGVHRRLQSRSAEWQATSNKSCTVWIETTTTTTTTTTHTHTHTKHDFIYFCVALYNYFHFRLFIFSRIFSWCSFYCKWLLW